MIRSQYKIHQYMLQEILIFQQIQGQFTEKLYKLPSTTTQLKKKNLIGIYSSALFPNNLEFPQERKIFLIQWRKKNLLHKTYITTH